MAKNQVRITGHVIDGDRGGGLGGLTVQAWDKDRLFSDLLGSTVTDEGGAFTLEFDESYLRRVFGHRRPDLFFRVFRGDRQVCSTEDSVLWNAGNEQTPIVIEVDGADVTETVDSAEGGDHSDAGEPSLAVGGHVVRGPAPANRSSATTSITAHSFADPGDEPHDGPASQLPTLDDLAVALPISAPTELLDRLAVQGVTSPDGLLTASSRGQLPVLPPAERPILDQLIEHAALATLPLTAVDRARLIAAGLRTPADVATETPERLAALLSDHASAEGIRAAAAVQLMVLGALETAGRVNGTNGVPLGGPGPQDASLSGAGQGECGCEDCRAATSPMAYLADLLNYATARLRSAGGAINVGSLASLLRQPLADLPIDCSTTEGEVAQVRLCIESIERLLREELRAGPDVAVAPISHRITFVIAADVDGDRQAELVIGFDEVWATAGEPVRSGIWVMRYERDSARWRHLRPGADVRHAALLLPVGMHATSAFAARFRPDAAPLLAERQQVVMGVSAEGEPGARFWVLQYEPGATAAGDSWTHLAPAVFAGLGSDIVLPVDAVRGAFGADVDGDGVDELVAYGSAPPAIAGGLARPDAFWVYDFVNGNWQSLADPASPTDVAFTCVAEGPGPAVRYAMAGDVDIDGREEIVALPDVDDGRGRYIWVMRYGGTPGQWGHACPQGAPLDADIDQPEPGPTQHILVGSVASMNRPDLLVARGPSQADPNRFVAWRYQPPSGGAGAFFTEVDAADAAAALLPADAAILADVDGDKRDELIVLTHQGRANRRDAAWVLDRDVAGVWSHLTPIAGHPLEADLEWTPGGLWPASTVLAADVDRDGRDELVFVTADANAIWVLDFDPDLKNWRHLSPVIPPEVRPRHVMAAYRALLLHVGTSFAEVRQARSADDTDRRALADRIGVRLDPNRPDALDELLLDPGTASMEQLERLFGLVSTERDPLSQGAAPGLGAADLLRWHLKGARWSDDPVCATTDPNGEVHLKLERTPPTIAVTAYRDAARTVAVALGQGPAADVIRLHDLSDSGLTGTVQVDDRVNASVVTLRVFPALAVHRWQRLRELWDAEDMPADPYRPGSEADDGVERRPVVDPAVIGPDDFRLPVSKAATTDADRPFDLWVRRRRWLDELFEDLRVIGSNFESLFASMRPAPGASAAGEPWAEAPADLDALAGALTDGVPDDVRAASRMVQGQLHLPVDAFLRLMALRKQRATAALRPEEWAEVRSILALAHRRSRFEAWRAEEAATAIGLDAAAFTSCARSVNEATWPPEPLPLDELPPGGPLPLVDPDRIATDDLPRTIAGDEARSLWRRRAAELAGNASVVAAARATGWEAQLVTALGAVAQPAPDWVTWIAGRAAELESSSPAVVAAAVAAIRTSLGGMGVPAFRRLAAVNGTLAGGRVPTEEARSDAERLLTAARKVNVLYPAWRGQESAAGRPLPYWRVLRFALARWQATAEDRQAWLSALAARCRPPVVDPDNVSLEHIRTGEQPAVSCSAEQRWTERRSLLFQREQALRGAMSAPAGRSDPERVDAALLDGLWTIAERDSVRADLAARRAATSPDEVIRQVFGADTARLIRLRADLDGGGPTAAAARRVVMGEMGFSTEQAFRDLVDLPTRPAGTVTDSQLAAFDRDLTQAWLITRVTRAEHVADMLGLRIADHLAPLRLDAAAWRRLVAIRDLAVAGGPLLDDETEDLVAILIRAEKERLFGAWQTAERVTSQRVRLGPDSFILPSEEWSLRELPRWRVRPAEARAWQRTLRARTEQHDAVLAALSEAVARVEAATLPAYRDDLLAVLPVASPEPNAAARWVADHLLVDPAESGIRRTTRVAHAIDTVLTLIWSVRTGQLRDTYPDLALDAPTFDQDWRWIGSYATWRSAMLVHLYPENLLRPTLRRYQSPALREALESLRSARQLGNGQARQIAARYAEYLSDVCRLDQRQVVCAEVETAWSPVLLVPGDGRKRRCELYATVSESSRRVYWALSDRSPAAAGTGYELSFWHRLDQFRPGEVIGLIGATQYVPANWAGGKRWLFLFAQTQDTDHQGLVFLRYDLDTAAWDGEPTPLEPPPGATEFSAWVFPTPPGVPPRVGFEYVITEGGPRETRSRSLNPKGTNWAREDFMPLGAHATWQAVGGGSAGYAGAGITARMLLSGDIDGDGRDELIIIPAVTAPPVVMRLASQAGAEPIWTAISSPQTTIPEDALVAIGRFAATDPTDQRDDLAWVQGSGPATLLRYTGTWTTIGETTGWTAFLRGVRHVVAGDFDGDGRSELAVAVAVDPNLGGGFSYTSAFFVLEGTPQGLAPKASLIGMDPGYPDLRGAGEASASAAFRCSRAFRPGQADSDPVPGFVLAGDFDGDGRDEIAAAIAPIAGQLSQGNDVWVMDVRARSGRWASLGEPTVDPDYPLYTVLDFSGGDLRLVGAVAGDFDGDGRDEIAVIPWVDDANSTGASLLIADFIPGPVASDPAVGGRWGALPNLDLTREGRAAGQVIAGDFDGDGADEVAVLGPERIWLRKYDVAADQWIDLPGGLLGPADPAGFAFGAVGNMVGATGTPLTPRRGARADRVPDQLALQPGSLAWTIPSTSAGPFLQHRVLGLASTPLALTRGLVGTAMRSPGCTPAGPLVPTWTFDWTLDDTFPGSNRAVRGKQVVLSNQGAPATVRRYVEEALYDLPVAIALALQASHDYDHALDWFRLVYDYAAPHPGRKVYYGLVADERGAPEQGETDPDRYARALLAWVRDPLDPHAIAGIRPHAYTRGTLQLLLRCLLDYADAEFTRDTPESVDRAWVLYETASDLLDEPVLRQRLGRCDDVIVRIPPGSTDPVVLSAVRRLERRLSGVHDSAVADSAAREIAAVLDSDAVTADSVLAAEQIAVGALASVSEPATVGMALEAARSERQVRSRTLAPFLGAAAAAALTELTLASLVPLDPPLAHASTLTGLTFCVSPNPVLAGLRLHAELNLFKLRNGRNIAGLRRTLDLYAAPTDQTSGLPMIGAEGQLVLPGLRPPPPTPYRYHTLVDQARLLAGQARETEAMMLASLEKRDAEALSLLRARQEVRAARAGVDLQELRVHQSEDRVVLAQLQQERAVFEEEHYTDLISAGPLQYERQVLEYLRWAAGFQLGAGVAEAAAAAASVAALYAAGKTGEAIAAGLTGAARVAATGASYSSTLAQIVSTQGGFQRTQQDWQFRQHLARFDRTIAGQQMIIESDGVRIAEQERHISEIQADSAEYLLEFQQAKFTNVELYDWMAEVLERTYRWYLQQATSMAQLAAQQLAFERQEGQPPSIQADYWEAPAQGFAALTGQGAGPDRRGLTGAERLLQDIAQLDQYAFMTARRKQQLTRTISLAQLDPLGLSRLRSDGATTFITPMRLFDEDFPGHHLRLIRRVSMSLVALVAPLEGIRATLGNTGTSRVVVGPDVFQTLVLRRAPESVSLTGTVGANGMFTFEPPTGLRDPFEGLGIDTAWELRLPKAANLFDFSTIADVVLTIDYTAIDSADHRVRVVRELDRTREGERGFSLRQDFPDAWWDLTNPDAVDTPLRVSFLTTRGDFPANLDELAITQVALSLVTESQPPAPMATVGLRFVGDGATARLGGAAAPVDGVVSTRRANGGPWLPITGKSPHGRWEIQLPDSEELRYWISASQLTDVLLVISYRAHTAAWPA